MVGASGHFVSAVHSAIHEASEPMRSRADAWGSEGIDDVRQYSSSAHRKRSRTRGAVAEIWKTPKNGAAIRMRVEEQQAVCGPRCDPDCPHPADVKVA